MNDEREEYEMAENRFRGGVRGGRGAWSAAGVAAFAAIVSLLSMAGYVFPGESARLSALWTGLDASAYALHPLSAFFAKLFGAGNLLAPACGTVAAVALYALVSFFVRERFDPDVPDATATASGRLAGLVAAGLFVLTPAVREASSHLNLAIFNAAWVGLTLLPILAWARARKQVAWLAPLAIGVMAGLGAVEAAALTLAAPCELVAVWLVASRRRQKPFPQTLLFALGFFVASMTFLGCAETTLAETWASHRKAFGVIFSERNSLFVILFAVVPFFVGLVTSGKSLNGGRSWAKFIFLLALTFVTILSIATPLCPSSLMCGVGVLPVFACAFAAATAGLLAVCWLGEMRREPSENDSPEEAAAAKVSRILAGVAAGVLALAAGVTAILNLFTFERDRGEFADRLADRLVADLNGRNWIVTNGLLDDHIRFAAKRAGLDVELVCLHRDRDEKYLDQLAETIKTRKPGGEINGSLLLSAKLGVLPFVEDWLSGDPDAPRKAVVFGQPDLWLSEKRGPVPEGLFFGGDDSREIDWAKTWRECRDSLEMPEKWGSYRSRGAKDPVEAFRGALRRHLGFLANDRGVWLWERGREDEAFDLFELVLGEIDPDNVSALFNECGLARAGHPRAAAKMNEIAREIKRNVDDPRRRYELWVLSSYYGYIRDPDTFARQGYWWASSGRPGEALNHLRRAGDLVAAENRGLYLNLLASLYAKDSNAEKSRGIYETILKDTPDDHDALVGIMRLFLADGDKAKALEYLDRAIASIGDDPRYESERVLACVLRDDLDGARKRLRAQTDADRTNFSAWAMLSAVAMQQVEACRDASARGALLKELEQEIVPMLEKYAKDPSDYNVQTAKAFLLMQKGGDNRRAARDALVAAAKNRPDIAATSDMILGLDMSLNDKEDAERQAREILRRDRKAPFANYIMGSLALQNGELAEAEAYLRRAVLTQNPSPLALNDLAEALRRRKAYPESIKYARLATERKPDLYIAWETLGSTVMESGGDLAEAEACILKACELAKKLDGDGDFRLFIALARVQLRKGEKQRAATTLSRALSHVDELSEFERREFEELRKSVR